MNTNAPTDPRRPNKITRYSLIRLKISVNLFIHSLIVLSISRYKAPEAQAAQDDPTPEYMNVLGMIFSMCGLMMRMKWCAWVALFCSCISFANSRANDDAKQMLSSFMYVHYSTSQFSIQTTIFSFLSSSRLSISAVVMCYLQNPQPIVPPWSSLTWIIWYDMIIIMTCSFDMINFYYHTRATILQKNKQFHICSLNHQLTTSFYSNASW